MTKEVRTVYLLESVDPEKRVGVLKIKPEFPKNGSWKTINVSISGLLAHRIVSERFDGLSKPDMFVGTKFTSTVDSHEFCENPFKLTKFIPIGKSDIPENYKLELVFERFSPKETIVDALGNKFETIRTFRRTMPRYYLRYIESETKAMLSSLPRDVVIITN